MGGLVARLRGGRRLPAGAPVRVRPPHPSRGLQGGQSNRRPDSIPGGRLYTSRLCDGRAGRQQCRLPPGRPADRKSTRLNSKSLMRISYAVFCLKKKKNNTRTNTHDKSLTGSNDTDKNHSE